MYKTDNKALLHSTGNYIQYLVKTIMEENLKRNIYVKLNHFAVHQTLAQDYKSTIFQLKKKKN